MSPRYNKKITRPMNYTEFKEGIQELPIARQAFLSILFFAGCRVSEALALTPDNIHCTKDTIFIDFYRLKGSKQTDPIPLPRADALLWLCKRELLPDKQSYIAAEDRLFPFSRRTAHRIAKRCLGVYPHYFRMNRIVQISDKFGDATVYSYTGICAQSIDHYRGKVDIMRVGKSHKEEIS